MRASEFHFSEVSSRLALTSGLTWGWFIEVLGHQMPGNCKATAIPMVLSALLGFLPHFLVLFYLASEP